MVLLKKGDNKLPARITQKHVGTPETNGDINFLIFVADNLSAFIALMNQHGPYSIKPRQ